MTEPRHVGVNIVFLRPGMGGMEVYVSRLLPELLQVQPDVRLTIFANPAMGHTLREEPWAGAVSIVTHPLLGRRYTSALSELTVLPRLVERERVVLLHNVAMIAPVATPAVTVTTVPDLIWRAHPDSLPRVTTTLWRAIVPPLARRADRVLTFSRASRDDIVRELGVRPEKVDAIPLGPGSTTVAPTPEPELRERFQLGRSPIVLAVSSKVRHKNLLRLVEAMALVTERQTDAVLVLPGHPTPYEAVLREAAQRLGIAASVRLIGWLDGRDLEGLYRAATCFVYPSLKEGFGLPVLEAMRRELPVACSATSSLPEVAGSAARYFDPYRVDEIAGAVAELLADSDLRRRLVAAGRERQKRFTWRATAEATLTAYQRAWDGRRSNQR